MKNWYIVQTFSGFENKVAETLKDTINTKELKDNLLRIFQLYIIMTTVENSNLLYKRILVHLKKLEPMFQ